MSVFGSEWSVVATEFALTWWMQAGLLVVAGLIAARIVGRRNAATESTIYKLTLVAAVACPLSTTFSSMAGLSLLTFDLQSRMADSSLSENGAIETTVLPRDLSDLHGGESSVASELPTGLASSSVSGLQHDTASISAASDTNDLALARESATKERDTDNSFVAVADRINPTGNYGVVFLLFAWIAGTTVLAIRFIVDLVRARKLCASSCDAELEALQVCKNVSAQLCVRAPRVRINPFISSPCLVGHWRPVILLPEDTPESSYVEVFLHELAHLRKSDWLWNTLGRMVVALLWTQPLLWMLIRRSASAAEDVCDDYVLKHGGNREGYVQRLVEIAETRLPSQAIAGVAMVSLNSSLGKRVKRILDSSRVISTTVGYRFGLSAVAAMAIMTFLVGAVCVGQPRQATADESQVESKNQSKESANGEDTKTDTANGKKGINQQETPPQDGEKIVLPKKITGVVLNPDGEPIAGAKVYMEDHRFKRDWNSYVSTTVAETTSNADGTYSFDVSKFDFSGNEQLVATAQGFGPAKSDRLFKDNTPTLRLATDRPINGRVSSLEGQPIAGVQVTVHRCVIAKDERSVDKWIAEKRPDLIGDTRSMMSFNRDPKLERTRFPGVATLNHGSEALPTTVTDADGKFHFVGLGKDRKCTLVFSGSGIATESAIVVTRKMQPFKALSHGLIASNSYVHHGADFNFIASPSQPIIGKATDADTGQPITGLRVRLYQQGKSTRSIQSDLVVDETNGQGEYRLTGARSGVKRSIMFSPDDDSPYFETELEIEKTSGSQPVRRNLQFTKAVWLSGKVTDQSGEGVSALVQYYPYRDNAFAERYPNFNPIITGSVPDQIFTDNEGNFRIRAIPGRGVLAAKVRDNQKRSEYISDVPADLLDKIGGNRMPKLFNPWSAKDYHSMREIEIAEDAREYSKDVVLKKGQTHRFTIQDPSGADLTSVRVMGRSFPPSFEAPLTGNKVEVVGLGAETRRLIVLMQYERGLGRTFYLDEANRPSVVQLQKCATLTGRVVDDDGEPVADVVLNVTPRNDQDNWSRQLEGQTTKADGRFKLVIPPGGSIRVWAYTNRGPNVSVELTPEAGAIYDVGDLKDGDKTVHPKASSSSSG